MCTDMNSRYSKMVNVSNVIAVQSLSCVQLFVTPWTPAHQAPWSSTISWSLLKFMSVELVVLSNHNILSCSLLLLPSIFPSIRVSSNELAPCIRYWELQLQHQSFQWILIPCDSTVQDPSTSLILDGKYEEVCLEVRLLGEAETRAWNSPVER